jgi:hypothetical protein
MRTIVVKVPGPARLSDEMAKVREWLDCRGALLPASYSIWNGGRLGYGLRSATTARLKHSNDNLTEGSALLSISELLALFDANHHVVVKINRIPTRRRRITAPLAYNLLGTASKEILTLDRGKGHLDVPIGDAAERHNLLGVGAPHNFPLGVAIHSLRSAEKVVDDPSDFLALTVPPRPLARLRHRHHLCVLLSIRHEWCR